MRLQNGDGAWLFPNEVLLHILKFVNEADRWNLLVTCTKFYELICSVEKNVRPLKINTEMVSSYGTEMSLNSI